jgi:hypothetical protein
MENIQVMVWNEMCGIERLHVSIPWWYDSRQWGVG